MPNGFSIPAQYQLHFFEVPAHEILPNFFRRRWRKPVRRDQDRLFSNEFRTAIRRFAANRNNQAYTCAFSRGMGQQTASGATPSAIHYLVRRISSGDEQWQKMILEPGDVLRLEDTTGKGHHARVHGSSDVSAMMIHLE
jgi:hypothetical protein